MAKLDGNYFLCDVDPQIVSKHNSVYIHDVICNIAYIILLCTFTYNIVNTCSKFCLRFWFPTYQELATSLQGADMPLRELYRFSLAPVDESREAVLQALAQVLSSPWAIRVCNVPIHLIVDSSQFAHAHSSGRTVTYNELCLTLKHSSRQVTSGVSMKGLAKLEDIHEIIDLYLWLRSADIAIFGEGGGISYKLLLVVMDEPSCNGF